MKVLITHELFMPDFAGGGEKQVYEMAHHLQQRGIKVTVLTTGNPAINQYKGIPTIRIPLHRYLMFLAAGRIKEVAKDCDLIQTSTYHAAWPTYKAARFLHKPVVCFVLGAYGSRWLKMRGILWGSIIRAIEHFILRQPYSKLLFISDYSKAWAREIGIDTSQAEVISPGVETGKYYTKKKQPYVLFSGRFAKQKGVYDTLEVAKSLPRVRFILMGWGEEEKKMKKLATKNVEFSNLRLTDGKPFLDMYAKALVFFMPSVAESFGFTIVEAMASGCAVVSTIDLPYKGRQVKSGDILGMARAIKDLMKFPAQTEKLGKENITIAKKYTWKKFTDKLIVTYQKLV
ncbi:MAG TPA: glycosyltransferase family 4 protein [Candidatus Nanoarchaeia archaeon]|nr:glycosyltransferase family 4 protein [Candidatus Nanoarchaeia archaeon]